MAKVTDQRGPIPLKSLYSIFFELTLQEEQNIEQILTVYRVKASRCEPIFRFYTYIHTYIHTHTHTLADAQ
jgi:hypothetical protein